MNHSFDEAYQTVKKLVQDFKDGSARYMRADYKEQAVRVDFIDPFFEALGWDVNHKEQRDPFKREVEAERSEKEGRVDYSFHLAPNFKTPVFFVEAKKPSVEIKNELHYKQTIGYSWNAGLPISILTDFQQFHILDCRNKVKAGDGSWLTGDHKEYLFTDFLDKDKFAEVYYLFSHEGVADGNIEKYVEKLRKPKGKAEQKTLFKGGYRSVDEDFLAYIDELREELAKALKKNNEELNSEELTEATQRIIDRLVFIRFLEDKGILDSYYVSEFGAKGSAWQDFTSTCLTLNTEYNGVVFKKHTIDEKHFAGPDDKMFRDICRDICHLNSAYNFNYIPIHILGSIYEQFLGKVVHATDKRVKIEEKPEVRKAGGVYYTPKYIVEYIVENTIGKLIKDKAPKEIAKLRFADIACGSGSFLISVYEHLLDYHTIYYNKPDNIVAAQKDGCRRDEEAVWQLSIEQKQDILRNNIYGVDIDAQAVEVSQLSLYLKMLENENVVTVAKHLAKKGRLFGADKILPDLSNNIKCGNSLIGSDIQTGQLFADDELKKLNPFDYEVEFPEIFKTKTVKKVQQDRYDMNIHTKGNIVEEPLMIYGSKERVGGFDAIVGNPPYLSTKRGFAEGAVERTYLQSRFTNATNQFDAYTLFIENIIRYVGSKGVWGYIIPKPFLSNESMVEARNMLLENGEIKTIADFGMPFKDASVEAVVIVQDLNEKVSKTSKMSIDFYEGKELCRKNKIRQVLFKTTPNQIFTINLTEKIYSVLQNISSNTITLKSIVKEFTRGIEAGKKDKSVSTEITANSKELLRGEDVSRYTINYCDWYVKPSKQDVVKFKKPELYEAKEKILIRRVGSDLQATLDTSSYWNLNTIYNLHVNQDYAFSYVLGLINSRLISFWFKNTFVFDDKLFPYARISQLEQIPIPNLNLTNKSEKAKHDQIVLLVDQMLDGKKKLSEAKTERDKEFYSRKCTALDKQIDDAVFDLYGLTEEEREMVLNS